MVMLLEMETVSIYLQFGLCSISHRPLAEGNLLKMFQIHERSKVPFQAKLHEPVSGTKVSRNIGTVCEEKEWPYQ